VIRQQEASHCSSRDPSAPLLMAAAGIPLGSRSHRAVGPGNDPQLDHTASPAGNIYCVRRHLSSTAVGQHCRTAMVAQETLSEIDGNFAPEFHVLTFKGSCFGEDFPEPRQLVAEGRLASFITHHVPNRREQWTNGRSVSGKCLSRGESSATDGRVAISCKTSCRPLLSALIGDDSAGQSLLTPICQGSLTWQFSLAG
jgi:hypothetical protein